MNNELRISKGIENISWNSSCFNRMVQLSRRLLTNIWVRGAYDHPDSIKPFKVSLFWTNVMGFRGVNIEFRKYLTIFLIFFFFFDYFVGECIDLCMSYRACGLFWISNPKDLVVYQSPRPCRIWCHEIWSYNQKIRRINVMLELNIKWLRCFPVAEDFQ